MKYFKTKHERNSARITALLMLILILLFFVIGPPYLDPPTEYGVAVNFGTTDFGSGNVQPLKPIRSEPKKINKIPQETPTESKPEESIADKVED
ncbi:MAG: energy transducer TonB, partial [Flavobacteriaceae bacterium]|nr:energy transducer TonB [Flavobacteriaceae bacterium]